MPRPRCDSHPLSKSYHFCRVRKSRHEKVQNWKTQGQRSNHAGVAVSLFHMTDAVPPHHRIRHRGHQVTLPPLRWKLDRGFSNRLPQQLIDSAAAAVSSMPYLLVRYLLLTSLEQSHEPQHMRCCQMVSNDGTHNGQSITNIDITSRKL